MSCTSIGGMKIIKIGACEICHSPFGQSEIYMHVKDLANKHYIFCGSIGNYGWSFGAYPLSEENPQIDDLQWCREWFRKYYENRYTNDLKRIELALNKYEFNMIFSMLGYNGNNGDKICSNCGKKVRNWWYTTDYLCSDCMSKERSLNGSCRNGQKSDSTLNDGHLCRGNGNCRKGQESDSHKSTKTFSLDLEFPNAPKDIPARCRYYTDILEKMESFSPYFLDVISDEYESWIGYETRDGKKLHIYINSGEVDFSDATIIVISLTVPKNNYYIHLESVAKEISRAFSAHQNQAVTYRMTIRGEDTCHIRLALNTG